MESITLTGYELETLLGAADPDGALLYLFLRARGEQNLAHAEQALGIPAQRIQAARQLLLQLGLLSQPQAFLPEKESPSYSEADVSAFMEKDARFRLLIGEAQRRLGRLLSVESMKTLLAIYDYLGLPTDVIAFLIRYCVQRAKARGNTNPPTMRTIEKEASRWAQEGLTTLPLAAEYANRQNERFTLLGRYRSVMGLSGKLSNAEEQYLLSWADMGFAVDAIALAYERTRLNTGALKWSYMNKILTSWDQQGLHTAQQAQSQDTGRTTRNTGTRRDGRSSPETGPRPESGESFEQQAVARLHHRNQAGEE